MAELITLLPAGGGPLDDAALEAVYVPPAASWVRCGFAGTVDGAVELDGRSGAIGGPADRRVFAALRAVADVVVAGSATVATEGYGQVRLDPAAQARREARGQGAGIPVAVVSTRGRLDPRLRLFREAAEGGPRPLVLTSVAGARAGGPAMSGVADVVTCGEDDVDPAAAVAALAERGLHHVLCEGGPTVASRWLVAGVVDELCLTTGPVLAGPDHAHLGAGPAWDRPVSLRLAGLLAGEGALFARYRTQPPEEQP